MFHSVRKIKETNNFTFDLKNFFFTKRIIYNKMQAGSHSVREIEKDKDVARLGSSLSKNPGRPKTTGRILLED